MSPRGKALKELKEAGYILKRNGGGHDIYYNPSNNRMIPLKRHDFNDNDLKYIIKEIEQNSKQ